MTSQLGSVVGPSLAAVAAASAAKRQSVQPARGRREQRPANTTNDGQGLAPTDDSLISVSAPLRTFVQAPSVATAAGWVFSALPTSGQQPQLSPRNAVRHVSPARPARVTVAPTVTIPAVGGRVYGIGGNVAAPCAGASLVLHPASMVVQIPSAQPLPVVHAKLPKTAPMIAQAHATTALDSSRSPSPAARPRDITLSSHGGSPAMQGHDSLARQLQALYEAKTEAAAQQAANEQKIADRQDKLRRETLEALSHSSKGDGVSNFSEMFQRWPSPRSEEYMPAPDQSGQANGSTKHVVSGSSDSTISEVGPGTGSPDTGTTAAGSSAGGAAHEKVFVPSPGGATNFIRNLVGAQMTTATDVEATGGTGCEPSTMSVAEAAASVAALAAAGGTGHSPRDSLCRGKAGIASSAPYLSETSEEPEWQQSAGAPIVHVAVTSEDGSDFLQATPPVPAQETAEVLVGIPGIPNVPDIPEDQPEITSSAAPRRQVQSARQTPTPRREAPKKETTTPRRVPAAPAKAKASRAPAAAAASSSQQQQQPRAPSPGQQGRSKGTGSREKVSPSQAKMKQEFEDELDRVKEGIAACIDTISAKSFRELRQMSPHPDLLSRAFEAVLTLLGADDLKNKTNVRRYITKEKLTGIDLMRVSISQFRRAQQVVNEPGFTEDEAQAVCAAAVPLVTWCHLVVGFLAKARFESSYEESAPVADGGVEGCTSRAGGSDSPRGQEASVELPEPSDAQDGARASEAPANPFGYLVVSPDLSRMSSVDLRQVTELSVSRPEVGSITFHGTTDCTNLDIPAIVHLDVGEVLVYPMPGTKPVVGQGLNKRATVTMYQCWPPNGRGNLQDEEAQDRYRRKIQQMTEEKRAKFIDYNCNTGVWKFQVEHF